MTRFSDNAIGSGSSNPEQTVRLRSSDKVHVDIQAAITIE